MQVSFEEAVEENRKSKAFDVKQFQRWWKNYNETKHEVEERHEKILSEARATHLKVGKVVEEWKNEQIRRATQTD